MAADVFASNYQDALNKFTDQFKNKKPIQYDPHLQNLLTRYFALPEMWSNDFSTAMKQTSQDLYKTLQSSITLGTMRDYVLVINATDTQIIIGFYNGDIYTYNKVNGSWIKQ